MTTRQGTRPKPRDTAAGEAAVQKKNTGQGAQPAGKKRLPDAASRLLEKRDSPLLNLIFSAVVPLVVLLTMEWVARISITAKVMESYPTYFPAFLLAYLLLVCLYVAISQLTGLHLVATLVLGVVCNVFAVVTHYKLTLRNEPFLPWDFSQIGDLMGVKSSLTFTIPGRVWVVLGILVVLCALSCFVKVPRGQSGKSDWLSRLIAGGAGLGCALILIFGVYLNPTGSEAVGLKVDPWRQRGYMVRYGVISSFLPNLQLMNVAEPEGYNEGAMAAIADEVTNGGDGSPLYENSFAATGGVLEEQPDIIYVMAEAFWDVTELDGITYDRDLLPNLTALKEQAAYGTNYSPSFGGGTCDVEFEALTGFSMEYLPSGSKPYQSYVTSETASLPQHLKGTGYQTLAIHGYGRKFWSRDVAYPHLGIDDFIATDSPQLANAERRRGFVSDNAMMDCIIGEIEAREAGGPLFIHAVTMQNHSTYSAKNYPDSERVKVTSAPAALDATVRGQLEDCATSIYEMDAALGKLVAYLESREKPTILVFWGDHKNTVANDYILFEATGLMEKGDAENPMLRETPLLIWSNFDDNKVELGSLSSYNISPVMMDLYGLEKPLMFEFLAQQYAVLHGHTKGTTIATDGSYSGELTEEQQGWFDKHELLQYDYMFGAGWAEQRTAKAEANTE